MTDNKSKLISFEKLNNIRDLGGMVTSDGRSIIPGRLLRGGHLSELTEQDKATLLSLADTVVDFRTDRERLEKPDAEIPGISYHHIPIMKSLTAGITREKDADQNIFSRLVLDPAEARQYMCDMYHIFAESDFAADQYARFIRLLMQPREKAVMWHCTAGKDRVGAGSAIIEEILGVKRDDIIDDYLMTNEYLQEDISFLTEFVKKQTGTDSVIADDSMRYLFGADRDYIEEYYHTIDSKYGSFEGFIINGLKLTTEDVRKLRSLYLTNNGYIH